MTTTMPEAPDASMLAQIVGDVFTGLLGADIEPPYQAWDAPPAGHVLPVCASVSVSGEWHGHVVFACSGDLARRVTADLLQTSPDGVSEDDLRDVIGEFVNVIGGNVKSVMPGPSALSLPRTALAGELAPAPNVEATRLELTWRNERICVSVWSDTKETER